MNETIQYDQLVAFLKNASLFEIYRVSAAIRNELQDPARIKATREKFKQGDVIEYFNEESNTFVTAHVLAKKHKYVSVQNCLDGRLWEIPYYLLKIDSRDFNFNNSKKGLSKNAIQVGDFVGFNKDGQEIIGRVKRLNQKTVSITTGTNHRWRVAYSLLYAVIDGEGRDCNGIENLPS